MSFDQLIYFISIVNCNSFSHAAEQLYISQSSLSKQIKSLETELDHKLFDRQSSHLRLTEFGFLFLDYARKSVQDYQQMLDQLQQNKPSQNKILRIGSLPVFLELDLVTLVTRFQQQNKAVNIKLYEESQEQLIKMLDDGLLDIIIARSDFMYTGKYVFSPIDMDVLCLVCSSQHKFANRKSVSIKELQEEKLVLLGSTSILYKMVSDTFRSECFSPNVVFTCNRHGHLLSIVHDNIGISILPMRLMRTNSFQDVVSVPLCEKICTTISVIRHKDYDNDIFVNRLFAYLRDAFAESFEAQFQQMQRFSAM